MVGKVEAWREAQGLWGVRSQVQPIEQNLKVPVGRMREVTLHSVAITGETEFVRHASVRLSVMPLHEATDERCNMQSGIDVGATPDCFSSQTQPITASRSPPATWSPWATGIDWTVPA